MNEKKMSAPEGLGEDPLGDDPLLETLYEPDPAPTARKRGRPPGGGRRPLADGQTYRLVTFSFYEEDVERLDALEVARQTGMPLAPVMIYGDDVTHVLTEEGIAYLYKARSLEERQAMIAAVAGISPIGLRHDPRETLRMRREGLIALPQDLGIRRTDASRELLAAKSIAELVEWSGGLYQPPARFRSW